MDFNDSPEDMAWRAECRAWLEANAPAVVSTEPGNIGSFEPSGDDYLARAKRWQAMKFDAGFARITWEPEFGGRNGTTMQQIIFGQEEARFAVPTEVFVIGLGMIAPTLRACGTDEQKQRYLTKLLRGEEIWSQLFSEPGAGSDVASLSTTAVRDGDEWVVNGQKVWTSGAQYSDFGEIVCRTNPEAEKHKGITAFIVDMRAPGVTIKPIKQMNGGSASTRSSSTTRAPCGSRARRRPRGLDGRDHHAHERARRHRLGWRWWRTGQRARPDRPRAQPRPEQRPARASAARGPLLEEPHREVRGHAHAHRRRAGQGARARGLDRQALRRADDDRARRARDRPRRRRQRSPADGDYRWHQPLLGAPAAHIAGGSDEVMKNIIGERVLGLPANPASTKASPGKTSCAKRRPLHRRSVGTNIRRL